MSPSPATHCVLCGAGASLAPRVHLREVRPGETPRDIVLAVCETHGTRLRNGTLRVTAIIEAWLTAEGRFNPTNPLDRLRLLAHCLACDAPLDDEAKTYVQPTGETVVECGTCPALNLVEPLGGDAVAMQLHTKPIRRSAR